MHAINGDEAALEHSRQLSRKRDERNDKFLHSSENGGRELGTCCVPVSVTIGSYYAETRHASPRNVYSTRI